MAVVHRVYHYRYEGKRQGDDMFEVIPRGDRNLKVRDVSFWRGARG
jgi:hypothetical protein